MKIKEALNDGTLSLEDNIDYADMTEEEYKQEIERLNKELEQYKYSADELNEIERLNNIIDELEKWLDKKEKLTFNSWNKGIHEVQRKLQELKGSDKE